MRYMGIDYGEKRVGIALSDAGGHMAFPHIVLENTPSLLKEVIKIIETERPASIVVGYSIDREGKENVVQGAIDTFGKELGEATGLPVVREAERYTTQEALRVQGRTEKTDASAAALILDSYLTRLKRTS